MHGDDLVLRRPQTLYFCLSFILSCQIDDELQFFLENNSEQIEAIVTNLSNELSGKVTFYYPCSLLL